MVGISVAYLAAASGIMIWRGISVSPDYVLVLLLPIAVFSGRFLGFLRDWVPFVIIFLAWEALRGLAATTGIAPHVADLAHLETTIFGGHLPTAVLQQAFDNGPLSDVLAYGATVVYFCHFVFPLAIGMVLWLVDRVQFVRFTIALMSMALVAFVFFLLVPTAPPWYALDHHVVSGFERIIGTTLGSAVSPYYNSLNPDPVAAFPSLHSAFPFLAFLALRRTYPRASWVALAWCVLVWFSVVYLGEHYVVDVVAGILMASLTWLVMMKLAAPRIRALHEPVPTAATSPSSSPDPAPAAAPGDDDEESAAAATALPEPLIA